jgi:hypothetical protein
VAAAGRESRPARLKVRKILHTLHLGDAEGADPPRVLIRIRVVVGAAPGEEDRLDVSELLAADWQVLQTRDVRFWYGLEGVQFAGARQLLCDIPERFLGFNALLAEQSAPR